MSRSRRTAGARVRTLVRRSAFLVVLSVLGCGDRGSPDEDVIVARIAGEPVRLSEIERHAGWRLHRARLDAHLLVVRETERWIEDRLLEQAASERGLDVEALLDELVADLPPIEDEEVDRYLAEHPQDASIEGARPRIRHYLDAKRRIERRLELVATLREQNGVEILLEPPAPPRIELDLRDAPARGPSDAPVTIVHFADLRRADSARSARDLERLVAAFPDRIRVVHRSLPRERDELGLLTAQLAASAPNDRVFWRLHDRIIGAGGVESLEALREHAAAAGLEDRLPGLEGDAASLRRVRRDLARAHEAGVRRAPTLFVNGRYRTGLDGYDGLRAMAEDELAGEEGEGGTVQRD